MGWNLCWRHENYDTKRRSSKKVYFTKLSPDRFLATFPEMLSKAQLYSPLKKIKEREIDEEKSGDSSENEEIKVWETTKDNTVKMHKSVPYSRKSRYINIAGPSIKEFDDWEIIESSLTNIKIKSISVYFNYYITWIAVTYVERDFHEIKRTHSPSSKYLNDRHQDCATLNLEETEYIWYIKYTYTTKTNYIRNIEIGTTNGKVMIVEGQVELSRIKSDDEKGILYNSIITGQETESHNRTEQAIEGRSMDEKLLVNMPNKMRVSRSYEDARISHLRRIKPSTIMETNTSNIEISEERIQEMDLHKHNQRLVGFKTKFSEYLLALEIYTEPCTYMR